MQKRCRKIIKCNIRSQLSHLCKNMLSREYEAAISVLIDQLTSFATNCSSIPVLQDATLSKEIYTKNTMFLTRHPLSSATLPKGDWIWNKSRPAANITIQGGVSVSFYKINSRKSSRSVGAFQMVKIWIYALKFKDNLECNFFWCENGFENIPIVPVNLEDLSFLKPYVCPDTAMSLGWN